MSKQTQKHQCFSVYTKVTTLLHKGLHEGLWGPSHILGDCVGSNMLVIG